VNVIAEFLSPTLWHDWIHSGIAQLGYAAFWLAVLQIIFVNLLLSGDNAVVIAMACRGLEPRQRRWGIALGAGVAVILRLVFIGIIARLMLLPYLKLAGGVALLIIAAKLVVPDDPDKDEVQAAAHLWRVVLIVAAADIVMSLDNVIAIAAVAQGNLLLLAIGLIVSIPLITVGAALIITLIDRFPIFVWAGAALLGWVAGEVIATDAAVVARLTSAFGGSFSHQVVFAAEGAGMLLAIGAGGLWRSLHETKIAASTAGAIRSRRAIS
jgi:YjbE family integral membrane protein